MNRKSFLKSIGLGLIGVFGLGKWGHSNTISQFNFDNPIEFNGTIYYTIIINEEIRSDDERELRLTLIDKDSFEKNKGTRVKAY